MPDNHYADRMHLVMVAEGESSGQLPHDQLASCGSTPEKSDAGSSNKKIRLETNTSQAIRWPEPSQLDGTRLVQQIIIIFTDF